MDTTRQDAWTKDEDVILAETVLQYIREGKTQLEAFKKVAKQLSRTSAACGFRWNASIRKQYKNAIEQAKEERKHGDRNKLWEYLGPTESNEGDKIDAAILLLKEMKYSTSNQYEETQIEQENTVNKLLNENERLKEQLNRYNDAWKEMGALWSWVKSTDHKTSNHR